MSSKPSTSSVANFWNGIFTVEKINLIETHYLFHTKYQENSSGPINKLFTRKYFYQKFRWNTQPMTVVFSLLGVTLKAVSMVPSSSVSSSLFGSTSLSACLEDPPTNPGEDTPKRTSGTILIFKLKKWWHGLSYEMLLSRVPDCQISQIIGQLRRLKISSAQNFEYKKYKFWLSRVWKFSYK